MKRLLFVLAALLALPSFAVVREGRVIISNASRPAFGSGYLITAYEPGAQVAQGSSGTVATVRAGHGLAASDYFLVCTSSSCDTNRVRLVSSVTATTVTFNAPLALASGEFLVNLGTDSGGFSPFYDGSGVTIYTDMAYTTAAQLATVSADSTGRYRYWHKGGQRIWELVRSTTGTPLALYTGAYDGEGECIQTGVKCAHLYATSGSGTPTDPWVTSWGNPLQAAFDACPSTGCTVRAVRGWYTLGAASVAVTLPRITTQDGRGQWSLIGDGNNATVFNYSGTGTAIRVYQNNSGSFQSSWQGNRYDLRGFAVRQTGTVHTGIGIELQYVSSSLFTDLSVGRLRSDHSAAGNSPAGFEYGIYCHGIADPSDNYSDFNQFRDIFLLGNKYAMDLQKGIDATELVNLWVEPDQSSSTLQFGVSIYNGNGVTIQDSHFNYFRGSNDTYALRIDGYAEGVNIFGNYFEGNSIGVFLNNYQDQYSINIMGNRFRVNPSGSFSSWGILAGVGGAHQVRGLNIEGNHFLEVNTPTGEGIRIRADVYDYKLIGNTYYSSNTGQNKVLTAGSFGWEFEPTTGSSSSPLLKLRQPDAFTGYISLENTDTTNNENSPGIIFKPGGSGSRPQTRLETDSNGTLDVYDNSGAVVAQVSQAGALNTSSNITSGGHLQGLTSAVAVSGNDAIATAGRFLIDLTNTTGSNTITLVAPSSVDGKLLVLRIKAITAGDISLADSGNVNLSAAWTTPGVGDTLTLIASGAVWYELARSNN